MLLWLKVLSDGAYLKKIQKNNRQGCRSKGEMLKEICPEAARAITAFISAMKMITKNNEKIKTLH